MRGTVGRRDAGKEALTQVRDRLRKAEAFPVCLKEALRVRREASHRRNVQMRRRTFTDFLTDDAGVTSIEYAMIAVLVSIVIMGGSKAIGTKLSSGYYGVIAAVLD